MLCEKASAKCKYIYVIIRLNKKKYLCTVKLQFWHNFNYNKLKYINQLNSKCNSPSNL